MKRLTLYLSVLCPLALLSVNPAEAQVSVREYLRRTFVNEISVSPRRAAHCVD